MNSGWVYDLHTILELAYFAAGIAIVVIAGFGLKQLTIAAEQLSLTKKIATRNEKRESLKFAAERCQYFAEKCVVGQVDLLAAYRNLGITYPGPRVKFSIVNEEIEFETFDQSLVARLYTSMTNVMLTFLNSLEAFSIPFAADLADDEVGFRAIAFGFCQMVEESIGVLILLRASGVRYESTIKLYDRWKSRLLAQNLEGKMRGIQEQYKVVAEKGKVKSTQPY